MNFSIFIRVIVWWLTLCLRFSVYFPCGNCISLSRLLFNVYWINSRKNGRKSNGKRMDSGHWPTFKVGSSRNFLESFSKFRSHSDYRIKIKMNRFFLESSLPLNLRYSKHWKIRENAPKERLTVTSRQSNAGCSPPSNKWKYFHILSTFSVRCQHWNCNGARKLANNGPVPIHFIGWMAIWCEKPVECYSTGG